MIDACEIGENVASVGEVKPVKVLGAMVFASSKAITWKVIVVDVDVRDALAARLSSFDDVERLLPGLLRGLNEWLMLRFSISALIPLLKLCRIRHIRML